MLADLPLHTCKTCGHAWVELSHLGEPRCQRCDALQGEEPERPVRPAPARRRGSGHAGAHAARRPAG